MAITPDILRFDTSTPSPTDSPELRNYARLRAELWPESSADAHAADFIALLTAHDTYAGFLALAPQSAEPLGFAECSIRALGANGCDTRPVVFLEGLYVAPAARRKGVARALVFGVETWGRDSGCTEIGSDALLDNRVSHATHQALGFDEVERVVCFRKPLARAG